jgi:hypothetical protein
MFEALRQVVGRLYAGQAAATSGGCENREFAAIEAALFDTPTFRSLNEQWAREDAQRAAARTFLENGHRVCAAELARASAEIPPMVAEGMRRIRGRSPDDPLRRRSETIGMTVENSTAMLLQKAQDTFDEQWSNVVATAARCYGSQATRRALDSLGFWQTRLPSGF